MSVERDPRNRNWRLVCHACSKKYPKNAACKPSCCAKPDLHIHNTDKPCVLCEDDAFDKLDKIGLEGGPPIVRQALQDKMDGKLPNAGDTLRALVLDVKWPSFQSQIAILGDNLHPNFIAEMWWLSWLNFWNMLGYATQIKKLYEEMNP